MPHATPHKIPSVFVLVVWLAVVAAGLLWLLAYDTAPGVTSDAPSQWPMAADLCRDTENAQLIMFAHPCCPCTRASLRELAQLMTDCQGLITAQVLFLEAGEGVNVETDLWDSAREIPGVEVAVDTGGREAKRFGVETSGHVLLYDTVGKLIFSGGITQSRGHSGDNAGRAAITRLLRQGQTDRTETFVFGCPLQDNRVVRRAE